MPGTGVVAVPPVGAVSATPFTEGATKAGSEWVGGRGMQGVMLVAHVGVAAPQGVSVRRSMPWLLAKSPSAPFHQDSMALPLSAFLGPQGGGR